LGLALGLALDLGLGLGLGPGLAGCALLPKIGIGTAPTRVEGRISAAAGLNPSVSQRPSPLVLRVYELRSATAFNQADFMALYQGDRAALAGDLVAREEYTLEPGSSRPYDKQLDPATRYIGVVGLYRDLEHATWRAGAAVRPARTQQLTIRADALALSVHVQ
ncbi:MAG: type VI secretion system lipoprotein TssJ, partial [Burkholderiales bacterium]|nr:type VI secretion system lipoprotein TssJ [Burkholderiales bacterium]